MPLNVHVDTFDIQCWVLILKLGNFIILGHRGVSATFLLLNVFQVVHRLLVIRELATPAGTTEKIKLKGAAR